MSTSLSATVRSAPNDQPTPPVNPLNTSAVTGPATGNDHTDEGNNHTKKRRFDYEETENEDDENDEDAVQRRSTRLNELRNRPRVILDEEFIPGIIANPFIHRLIEKKTSSDPDIDDIEAQVLQLITSTHLEPSPVTRASDIDYFNCDFENGHEDDAWRHVSYTLLMRYHFLSDDLLVQEAMPTRFPRRGPNAQLFLERCRKYTTRVQSSILTNLEESLRLLICRTEKGVWQQSTVEERRQVLTQLWDQAPLHMAEYSIGITKSAVPLRDIFSMTTPSHIKWQRFFKTMFLWTVEKIFTFLIYPAVPNMLGLQEAWKNLPLSTALQALDLGRAGDIPVKKAGVFDHGRRFVQKIPEDDQSLQLAD